MRVHRSVAVRLLPVIAAGIVLAGCGSSSTSTNAAATSASAAGAGSTTASTAASTPSDTAAASAPAVSGDGFCAKIVSEKKQLTTNELPALLQNGSPAAWKKYLEDTMAMNDALFNAAPAELKGAVDQLRQVNVKLTAMLSAAGYDVRKVKATALMGTFSSADYQKAGKDFTSYVSTHCSIDLTKP